MVTSMSYMAGSPGYSLCSEGPGGGGAAGRPLRSEGLSHRISPKISQNTPSDTHTQQQGTRQRTGTHRQEKHPPKREAPRVECAMHQAHGIYSKVRGALDSRCWPTQSVRTPRKDRPEDLRHHSAFTDASVSNQKRDATTESQTSKANTPRQTEMNTLSGESSNRSEPSWGSTLCSRPYRLSRGSLRPCSSPWRLHGHSHGETQGGGSGGHRGYRWRLPHRGRHLLLGKLPLQLLSSRPRTENRGPRARPHHEIRRDGRQHRLVCARMRT